MAQHRMLVASLWACAALLCLPAEGLAKQPSRTKCKRGSVPVKVQGRARCQKLRSALPRPQKGDPRVAFLQGALGADPGAIRDRHGRLLPPLSRLAGGKPYRAFVRNLPRALAHLDALSASHAGRERALSADAGCQSGLRRADSYQGSDGTSVGVTANSDGTGSVTMSTSAGNGVTVAVEFDVSQCDSFKVPSCPTADGQLDGTDKHPLHARIEVSDAHATLRLESITSNSTESLHGEVADDAKLDQLVINDNSSFSFVFGGSQIGHVISQRAMISRQAIVNMRFGYPAAFDGAVSISGSVDGIALSHADLAAAELRAKASFDKEFAQIVKQEIDRYRSREQGFDTPNACVQTTLSPLSNTLTLDPGSSGSFQAQLDMKDGGGAPVGQWKITSQHDGTFTPATAQGHRTTFRYTVPSKPSAAQITAALTATSKAGIAAGDWTQAVKPGDLYFRVVGYSRNEQSATSHGQRTVTGTLSGGPGPVTTVPACADPSSCSNVFEVDATVTDTENMHVTGTADPSFCPGGAFTYPTSTIQNPLREAITFDPAGTAPASASAGMVPSVGDVAEDFCGANDSGEAQSVSASVPAADLLSGNPVTFSFSGSGTVPSFGDHSGLPITWMLSESVTVQRVQADGSPFRSTA